MDALVLGRPGLERSRLRKLLLDADFGVNVCHDRNWGCIGMEGPCPLDELSVDVAVAVSDPGDRFDTQGIACVHRARIPIVTIGATEGDPVLRYTTTNLTHVDASVIRAVRAAASDAAGHRVAVEATLARHLDDGEHLDVTVRRSTGAITVLLTGNVAGNRAAALADMTRAAIRAHDPHAQVIDVSVATAD